MSFDGVVVAGSFVKNDSKKLSREWAKEMWGLLRRFGHR